MILVCQGLGFRIHFTDILAIQTTGFSSKLPKVKPDNAIEACLHRVWQRTRHQSGADRSMQEIHRFF